VIFPLQVRRLDTVTSAAVAIEPPMQMCRLKRGFASPGTIHADQTKRGGPVAAMARPTRVFFAD
jgi:hypothetical protein